MTDIKPKTGSTLYNGLTEDVWRCIFDMIVEEERQSSVILPLLGVCKMWKALAGPLLYHHLEFNTAASISALHKHLLWEGLQDRFPGSTTRSITLAEGIEGDLSADLSRVLKYTPQLLAFHARTARLTIDPLETMAQVCRPTLRYLSVQIGGDGEEAALQVALLGRFPALKELEIHISELGSLGKLSKRTSAALKLPALDTFTLRSPAKEPLSEFLEFLGEGSFPALTVLLLDLPWLGPQAAGTTPAEALLPFFTNVGPQVTTLTGRFPLADNAASLLFPLLKSLRVLRFPIGKLPKGVVKHLPTTTEELDLGIKLGAREQMQALMEALKQLSDDDDRVFDLSIHLISETDEPFSWWTLGDINTAVAGQLMPLSLWLFAKGILLKDEEFEWVGQCREDA